MDPNSLGDLFLAYGPYGVLAVFILWVAPRQIKVFLNCKKDDTAQRFVCGGIAVGSWLVVGLMIWYIVQNWPPKQVYTGSLGTHAEQVEIISTDDHLLIASRKIDERLKKLKWKFALITETGKIDPDKKYSFSYIYEDENGLKHKDYYLLGKDLAAGTIELFSNKQDPSSLLIKKDDRMVPYPHIASRMDSGSRFAALSISAQAQANTAERDTAVIKALTSKNAYFRAHARKQLRNMKAEELRRLLSRGDLPPEARRQIKNILRQR